MNMQENACYSTYNSDDNMWVKNQTIHNTMRVLLTIVVLFITVSMMTTMSVCLLLKRTLFHRWKWNRMSAMCRLIWLMTLIEMSKLNEQINFCVLHAWLHHFIIFYRSNDYVYVETQRTVPIAVKMKLMNSNDNDYIWQFLHSSCVLKVDLKCVMQLLRSYMVVFKNELQYMTHCTCRVHQLCQCLCLFQLQATCILRGNTANCSYCSKEADEFKWHLYLTVLA